VPIRPTTANNGTNNGANAMLNNARKLRNLAKKIAMNAINSARKEMNGQ
jgi:hypothetical protein